MERPRSADESFLCDQCSVLYFNDEKLGGCGAMNDAGKNVLTFDHLDLGGVKERRFKLDYTHHDVVPDFPYLKASAEAGCAFCVALRNAAIGLDLSKPGRATFTLTYVWRPGGDPDFGLHVLLAGIHVEFDTLEHPYTNFLVFCIDCEEGKKMNE
jgi:hypothetical protein